MNKYILLPFLLLWVISLQAQQSKISGRVRDSISNLPVAYASIGVLGANNQVVEGMMTDSAGTFLFSNLKAGNYTLLVKFIGYNQKQKTFKIGSQELVNLGDIVLSSSNNQLQSITVTGTANAQKHTSDRQVYQTSQYKNAVGGTALDIIKNLPAASVDGNGNISIRGNVGVLVLVNGKPSLLDPQTILSQIAANDVTQVEYITSPSAQFDPDGKAGIINLKTKTNLNDGFFWLLNLQGGLPSLGDYDNAEKQQRYGADVSFQYKKDKFELNGSANFLRNDNAGFREGDVHTIIDDRQTFFPSAGERSFDKYNYGLRLNSSYEVSKKHSFNLGVLASKRFQDRLAAIHYSNRTIQPSSGNEISSVNYFNPNLQNKQGEFYLMDFLYQYKVNPNHTLQLGAIYEYANIHGSTLNTNIENVTDTVQWSKNVYKNPLRGLRLSLQHSWKIGHDEIKSGYQLRQDKQKGNFDYFASNGGENDAVLVPEFTGKLTAQNIVHAFFSQYDKKYNKTSLSLGLRYEYYQRDLLLLNTKEEFPYSIHQLYPSLNIMHDFTNDWSWKFSAARRVQRNNNFELNPIPEREHSETLEQGDPELLPEFTTNVETGLVKKFNSSTFFFNAYYQHTKNPIQRVNSVYADTILHRVFTNADYADRWGMEAGMDAKLQRWLQLNIGLNVYNYKISGQVLNYQETRTNQDWIYSLNSGLQANLSKNWSLGLQLNYISQRPTVQGIDSRFITPHLNLSKSFLKGALVAQLQWQNIELGDWGVNEQRITTFSNDFYTMTNYVYEKNVLLVNLKLNLQKLNQVIKLPKSEFGEKEF